MSSAPADPSILRGKYLDWCSARVAERFLRLTPDEIYQLAQTVTEPAGAAAARADPAAGGNSTEPATETPGDGSRTDGSGSRGAAALSYRALVQRVTEVLTSQMDLPTYEEWSAAYRATPERFEEELLGFWKTGA